MDVTLKSLTLGRKARVKKLKKTDIELTNIFWCSPPEALFVCQVII